jgi:uncharacterized membrane protein
MEISDSFLRPPIDAIRFALEATGAFWIAMGGALALFQLLSAHIRLKTASFTPIRLTFSRYLSLALEFQLASDILTTALAPSWEQVGKLGAIAVIRTPLNYFLSREMREYSEKLERDESAVVQKATSAAASSGQVGEYRAAHT